MLFKPQCHIGLKQCLLFQEHLKIISCIENFLFFYFYFYFIFIFCLKKFMLLILVQMNIYCISQIEPYHYYLLVEIYVY